MPPLPHARLARQDTDHINHPDTMKERPILFSGPMVRAILSGAKTQTRRVITDAYVSRRRDGALLDPEILRRIGIGGACPYGAPGDRLWVRETWRLPLCLDHLSGLAVSEQAVAAAYPRPWAPIRYEADADCGMGADDPAVFGAHGAVFGTEGGRLRPSIHMPRWASRLLLEVTDVRVERVQEITEPDALAEGVEWNLPFLPPPPRDAFAALWDSINAARGYGWDANPWVWAVSFKVLAAARGEVCNG